MQKACLVLIGCILSGFVTAQDTLFVKDDTGAAVPFAQIALQDFSGKNTKYVQSNEQGVLVIPTTFYASSPQLIVKVNTDGFHQEIDTISKGMSHRVKLATNAKDIDEVVVTGQLGSGSNQKSVRWKVSVERNTSVRCFPTACKW